MKVKRTATLPYLNALEGKGAHLVTVNDYLAKYQAELMGKIYNFLRLSVGIIIHGLDNNARRKAYNCDITYGTNNEFGFDYLRDNMVVYKDRWYSGICIMPLWTRWTPSHGRGQTLIISGREESTELYDRADRLVRRLKVVFRKHDKQLADDITRIILLTRRRIPPP